MPRKHATGTSPEHPALTRTDVVDAALRLLGRSGAEAWSMRALARELSVSVSTLYWHVRDKRALLELVLDASMSTIEIPDDGTWAERLAEMLRQARRALRAHPALVALIWQSGWDLGPKTLQVANTLIGLVGESGMPEDEVADAYFMVIAYLFGFVAMETASPDTSGFNLDTSDQGESVRHLARYRPGADLAGMDRRFERGITRILNSLEPA